MVVVTRNGPNTEFTGYAAPDHQNSGYQTLGLAGYIISGGHMTR